MNAGRELDALVAEKVMGWREDSDGAGGLRWHTADNRATGYGNENTNFGAVYGTAMFRPSTDIACAWLVVEKLGGAVHSPGDGPYERKDAWAVFLNCPGEDNGGEWGYAPTAPHAICLAALKAVGAL